VFLRFGNIFRIQYLESCYSGYKNHMLKFRPLLFGCFLAIITASYATSSSAQTSGANTESLGQMPCQNIEDIRYQTSNEDVSVGYEVFRTIGLLRGESWQEAIRASDTGAFVCRLAASGQRPVYRTLNLAFGINDDNDYVRGSTIRLSVYLNGDFYQYQDVTPGQKYIWPIDVTDTRSVALEVECIRGRAAHRSTYCPALHFFEDSLE
jgi:hypothetical protein